MYSRLGIRYPPNRDEMFIAGGVESMTRAPFAFAKPEAGFARQPPQVWETTIGWRFTNPRLAGMGYTQSLGETAENIAEQFTITREAQDRFALQSQQRAAEAMRAGRFDDEIVPVPIHLVELNEAFASQAIACIDQLGLDPTRVNVNGSTIALGHPLGASGARILATLAHELRRRGGRYGLATMCIGVGQGIATIIEAM